MGGSVERDDAKLAEMYLSGGDGGRGMSLSEASAASGRSRAAVRKAVIEAGGSIRPCGRRPSAA